MLGKNVKNVLRAKMMERKKKRQEKGLTATFNAAAELEQALTTLQKANPKFQFVAEKNENGMDILTNIPLFGTGRVPDYMEIKVTAANGIRLSVEPPIVPTIAVEPGFRYFSAHRSKAAVKCIKEYIQTSHLKA